MIIIITFMNLIGLPIYSFINSFILLLSMYYCYYVFLKTRNNSKFRGRGRPPASGAPRPVYRTLRPPAPLLFPLRGRTWAFLVSRSLPRVAARRSRIAEAVCPRRFARDRSGARAVAQGTCRKHDRRPRPSPTTIL